MAKKTKFDYHKEVAEAIYGYVTTGESDEQRQMLANMTAEQVETYLTTTPGLDEKILKMKGKHSPLSESKAKEALSLNKDLVYKVLGEKFHGGTFDAGVIHAFQMSMDKHFFQWIDGTVRLYCFHHGAAKEAAELYVSTF